MRFSIIMQTLRLASICLLWLSALATEAQKPLPELWNMRVHDDAHVLSHDVAERLEQQLKAYEDSTSNQIAILTITSLDGDVLEEYSLRVAEKWKLGSAKNDNGVLLLVAVDDRKMRIEVGQGLEGVLTDAQCNRIIRNDMAPYFRRGDYDGGIEAGIQGIILSIGGEYSSEEAGGSTDFEDIGTTGRLIFGLLFFTVVGLFTGIALFSKGGIAWFLYAFLLLFYLTFPMVIFGVDGGLITFFTYLIGFPVLKIYLNRHPKWKEKMMKWQSRGGGGWRSGGWSSGGGGWSSGGGFSGGGGSFGGGGSSGSW